ncbi:hypothetical protein LIER_38623 [Lithospermum erythrorhizon]|uniref:Uncharacterized protein n=1 Tax=Lithospermum erythrorhizon TaxID=34254 RepID=A0AAV3Q6R1_LITER
MYSNTIPAVVFDSVINWFDDALYLHGVYNISNAVVKPPTGKQLVHGYSTNWVLPHITLIRPLCNEPPTLLYIFYGITPINMIAQAMANTKDIIDIMAIVIKYEDSRSLTT